MTVASLEMREVSVGYGPVRALSRVSVKVPEGAVVTVLGGNGAGKSTLMRAISRTLRFHGGVITSGAVTFGDRRLDTLSPAQVVAAGVVQVPEGRQVFSRMTVADNLRAGSLGASGGRKQAARTLKEVYDRFPVLAERAHQRAGLLSGGEQQMLALGRAMMARPRLLLLDEPTLGLAPLMAQRIAETVTEINAQGTSVLLVEQNAAVALRLAALAYVLEVGEVALHGPADELAASDEVRRRYLGVTDATDATDDSGGADAVHSATPAARPGQPVPTLSRWAG